MGKGKQDLLNIFKVVFSNFSLLGAGIVTSFVLPAFLSMEDFGYYKIFNLYVTYIIILQFGIVENLYMKYGGKNFEDVDKKEFSSCFSSLFYLEILVGFILILISLIFFKGDNRFIGIALAINVIIVNLTNLYQYLSQAIQRFSELSARNVAKAVLTIASIFIIFFISKNKSSIANYEIVVIITVAINFILLLWYMYTYRGLFVVSKPAAKNAVFAMIKNGFPLCLANIISTLILNISRQIVSLFFSTTDYAIYSFAYSLLTLISTVVASVAVVMFSMFKKQDRDALLDKYSINVKIVSVLMAFAATVFFPLHWFVNLVLPEYSASLEIFRIVIPGLIFSSSITVVMHNYFKTLEQNTKFFIISVITLGVSVVSGVAAYYIFGTMEAVSWISVGVMLIWYVLSEGYLKKSYNISSGKNLIFLIVMSIIFYAVSLMSLWYLAMFIYLVASVLVTLVFYSKDIRKIFSR